MGQSKSLLIDSKFNYQVLRAWHPTKKLVSAAILAVFTAILQSAGGILPGIGLMVSPFSTVTILLAAMISFQHGLLTYLLTIPLLLLLEPSELFIYGLSFPILGPIVPTIPEVKSLLLILGFASLYSWLWLEVSLYFLYRVNKFLS